jgi:hypothetical protein
MAYKEYYLDNIKNRTSQGGYQKSESQSFNKKRSCSRRSRCKKLTCKYCGAKDNFIHKKRLTAIHKRINIAKVTKLRFLVFTVPPELRSYFCTTKALNQLFKLVLRVIKQFFGVEMGCRDSAERKEKKYTLQKECFATLHLHGKYNSFFHPHINVIIIEHYPDNERLKLFLSDKKLKALRESYKQGLQGLVGTQIEEVDVNYRTFYTEEACETRIRYITTPPDPIKLKQLFKTCLSEEDFKNFRIIRFWGKLSNSEYKSYKPAHEKQFGIDSKFPKPKNNPASRAASMIRAKDIPDVPTGKVQF